MYVIFLYLHKSYNTLDRSRCLDILEVYCVGPRALRLLQKYWSRMRMVARAGVYYRVALTGARGVTQGYPLSPTIFNMVVDAIVQHWVSVMVEVSDERGGREQEVRLKNTLFYADDGMVVSSDLRFLQGDFSTLVGLFDRVGLSNTFSMVCRSLHVAGHSQRRLTGDG